ncbi:hypothetical protein ACTJLD_16880 [Burkholderia sp. 22088]|uniref:hypothetical protein n=1 Tax=Burkholderia sp. 22088 TaxID=3453871 RepID=UPI003F872566
MSESTVALFFPRRPAPINLKDVSRNAGFSETGSRILDESFRKIPAPAALAETATRVASHPMHDAQTPGTVPASINRSFESSTDRYDPSPTHHE